MKIVAIDTIRHDDHPSLCHVLIHTGDGVVGLGETFVGAQAVEAFVHETAAAKLLGADPQRIEGLHRATRRFVGGEGTGVEQRGRSALDIALWDIAGQVAGVPLYQLLGGACRDQIAVYNSCAGYHYGRGGDAHRGRGEAPEGPYEDLDAFFSRPEELARSLVAEGIRQAKVWPFDRDAAASGGTTIAPEQIERGLEPIRRMKDAAGAGFGVMLELHGLWNVASARQIAAGAEELDLVWIEDPVPLGSADNVAAVAAATSTMIAGSETIGTATAYREYLERRALDVVIADVSWCGGVTEARRIAALADAYGAPFAPHDCSGPVVFVASTHLCMNLPNALVQEFARSFHSSWYGDLVTGLPSVLDGHVSAPARPGLGVRLRPDVLDRPGVHVRRSELAG